MTNAIIYTRVSTDEQANSGYSLPFQLTTLQAYCKCQGINIIKHYKEDFSAKNFDRPEFNKLKEYSKANKHSIDLLLFTKWDRFSRNAEASYKVIKEFKHLGIKVNSIEQPLDLDLPDNKILLAIYLMLPEVENDKISQRTTEGMRKASIDGCWMGAAPRGYNSSRDLNGNSTLTPNQDSEIIKKIFIDFSTGLYTAEKLRKKHYNNLKFTKQSFLNMLRNPVYIGKIKVKEYKKEKEQLVDGLHKSIINESVFEKVKNILSRNKKITIKPIQNEFPLRGFLKCNSCNKNLTGSFSTSRSKKKYPYYHCQSGCKERHNAVKLNNKFITYLSEFELKPESKALFLEAFKLKLSGNKLIKEKTIKSIEKKISKQQKRIEQIEDNFADEKIDYQTFSEMKIRFQKSLNDLKVEKLHHQSSSKSFIRDITHSVNLLSNIGHFYKVATTELKRKIIGSIFNEKLVFNGKNYRTLKDNKVLKLIYLSVSELKALKTKKVSNFAHQSSMAPPTELLSNQLRKDAHQLYLLSLEIPEFPLET
jgi:DNA invertase Pin-like site-specific DNA recombinase